MVLMDDGYTIIINFHEKMMTILNARFHGNSAKETHRMPR